MWAEATLQFNDWKEYFQSDKPTKRVIHEDFYFVSSIWARNNVRYSGIHRLNKMGEIMPKTGINLDNFEWLNVMKKVDEINVELYGPQALKGEKRRASVNEVQVWSYKWFLNSKEVEIKDVTSRQKFFYEIDARREGNMNKPALKLKNEDKLEMEVIGEFAQRPSELLQMRMVLHQIAKACVDVSRFLKCPACQQEPSAPGQKSHMQPGGCMNQCDLGDECTEFVYGMIQPDDLIAVYDRVCKMLQIPYSGSALLAKAILAWLPKQEVEDTITEEEQLVEGFTKSKNPVLMIENYSLRDVIRQAYFDLNMHSCIENRFAKEMFGN